MTRSLLATMAICGLLAAAPVIAGGGAQKNSQTIMQIQEKLQQQGFDTGAVDGKWGPKTAEALKDFQQKQGMTASGELDQSTLQALGVQAAGGSSREVGSGSSTGGMPMGPGTSTPPHTTGAPKQ